MCFDTVGHQEEHPACKNSARCRLFACGLADDNAVTKTPSLFTSFKSRLVFIFLLPAYLGCPGKETVKRV